MINLPSELVVVIAGHTLSALLMLFGGVFVLSQNWRRLDNRLFFFVTASTFVYEVAYIVAALQTSYSTAYFWWSLNIVDAFIPVAAAHFILRVCGRDHSWRWFIRAVYAVGTFIFVVGILEPAWFMPSVSSKFYFLYYIDGGWWYVVMLTFFLAVPVIAAANLISVYRNSMGLERKRLEYFILMLLVGYAIGCINFFLVFNIPIDPLPGAFTGCYLLPIAYGIFATDLLDIRIAVRRALYYALGVGVLTALLTTMMLLNADLVEDVPGLMPWMLPLLVALVVYAIAQSIYWQFRESERLKYEFIAVATHKLRTPLTRIHWSVAEVINLPTTDQKTREALARIDDSSNRLIELTTALIEISHLGQTAAIARSPVDLEPLVHRSLERFTGEIAEKKLGVLTDLGVEHVVRGEERSIGSVVDVLIENAIAYTPAAGTVQIRVTPDPLGLRFSVTDTGMGVAPEDRSHIFADFFRANSAKTADTEGTGLGLSLAKDFITRLEGTIGFDSEGPGKGSTFWFILPKAEKV